MSSQTAYVNSLNSASNAVVYYALWTILPTCVIGNIIYLIVFTRPSLNKKTNTGFLYSWLCILNIIAVVYYCVFFRGATVFNLTVTMSCGLTLFIQRTEFNMISWLQVFICLDRFIAVYFPTKASFMSKKFVLYGAIIGLLVFMLIINLADPIQQNASLNAKNVTVFMLVLNLLVIRNLRKSKIRVGLAQAASQLQNNQISNRQFRFMVSTLIIDFMYLIFYLPFAVGLIVKTYDIFSNSLASDPVGNDIFNLYSSVAQMFALGHSSVLFFLFLIFNRIFRAELIILLRLDKIFSSLKPGNSI